MYSNDQCPFCLLFLRFLHLGFFNDCRQKSMVIRDDCGMHGVDLLEKGMHKISPQR